MNYTTNWMPQKDYRTEALEMIDKMQSKIKTEEEKINDCNLNIHLYLSYMIEKIHGLYINIPPKSLNTLWCGFHKNKEEMSEEDKNKYKASYDFINHEIINSIICDTRCKYKKSKIISEVILEGYDEYAYNIHFIVNNIDFTFIVPCVKNINEDNLIYANYGKYGLAYKESPCCTSYICTSYNMEDLAKAFKEFIAERNSSDATLA